MPWPSKGPASASHRPDVASELRFAIMRSLREAGIEIPFPQRDLHIKNWPGAPTAAE